METRAGGTTEILRVNGRGVENSPPRTILLTQTRLYQPLIQHRISHFHEAGDVGAVDEVAGRAVLLGRLIAIAVDGDHDLVQLVIHFLAGSGNARAVLRHFET